jgi:hypothetical protein
MPSPSPASKEGFPARRGDVRDGCERHLGFPRQRLADKINRPLHLIAHCRHDIEDQSGEAAQETDDDQTHVEDGRRQPGHQSRFQIGLSKRNRERHRGQDEDCADQTEELQRPLVAHQIEDEAKDSGPVPKGAELARGARRTFAISRELLCARHAQLQSVHRQFGFDFETSRRRRK